MNNNMNEQNNQGTNNTFQSNGQGQFVNNMGQPVNPMPMNNNAGYTNYAPNNNAGHTNYAPSNNAPKNKKSKTLIIIVAVIAAVIVLLILMGILIKPSENNINKDNIQNDINNNKNEGIVDKEENPNNTENEIVADQDGQLSSSENENVVDKEEQISNNGDTYLPNTDIIKRSLGETSKFDNGISIKITDSIEYLADAGIHYKPMFIKVEINNNSNKNFYQNEFHGFYTRFEENPVEFIREDFDYTGFDMQPIYMEGEEAKTEGCGCVLRKRISTEVGDSDGHGGFKNVNYFALRPGEQTTAYLMCYFREEIKDAKIKGILLFKDSNKFMYFLD